MPDLKPVLDSQRKVPGKIKHRSFTLSAALILISYLGFMSISLVPISTDNFKEYSGNSLIESGFNLSPLSTPAETSSPTLPLQTSTSTATLTPIPTQTSTSTPFPTHTSSPVPTLPETSQPVATMEGKSMDWGDWSCRYCDKMPAKVKMSHYWPPLGGENCWWFYEGYCHSPMKSSVPWETLIELAAACPVHWLGGVVEIPDLGRRYLCLDTGDKVICENDVCIVDVLTDKTYPWEGQEYDAVVYYPRVWTDGSRPQVTPFADGYEPPSP